MRPDAAGLLGGGNTPTALRFSYFHFSSVMAFVSPCPVHPPYTLFELPLFLSMASPLPPQAVCLGCPPRLVHILSPQSPWPFGRTIFPSCMFSLPPEVPPFTPPRPPRTTTLNRGLWQPGAGMSQQENVPHGKLYLFFPNAHLTEMSQAYPENWVRVAATPSHISET